MKPKVYLETTIPSYLASRPSRDLLVAAHQQITVAWWESRRSEFDVLSLSLSFRRYEPETPFSPTADWRSFEVFR